MIPGFGLRLAIVCNILACMQKIENRGGKIDAEKSMHKNRCKKINAEKSMQKIDEILRIFDF